MAIDTNKTVVLFSGGLDSTCLLARILKFRRAEDTIALSINYGQRHIKELTAARSIAEYVYGVEHITLCLPAIGSQLRSSQTNKHIEVPEGHYADESMKITVVPNRNMIMLAIAAGIAESRGFNVVAFAAHSGDHAIYPDCRPSFVNRLQSAFDAGMYERIAIAAPYLEFTKAEIIKDGAEHNAPLGLTWSCYKGGELHCGKCGTCVERREAFQIAGVPDPTKYAAV